jgi:D-amino-acid dehydrogenase
LSKQLVQAGGSQRAARVQRLAVKGSTTAAVLEGGEVLNADVVVVAAGVASGALLQSLGYRVPIIAERGYHISPPLRPGPPACRPSCSKSAR